MSYTLLSDTRPKARKIYRCIWCPERIQIGEIHVHEASVFDRDFQNHRWHLECYTAALQYFRKYKEDIFEPHASKRGTMEEYKHGTN